MTRSRETLFEMIRLNQIVFYLQVVEKLEITVNEYNVKIEDLNRTVSDVSSAKQRLQMEAQESAKKLNEMKLSLEHAGLDKNKFATQLDELRRAADNEARK